MDQMNPNVPELVQKPNFPGEVKDEDAEIARAVREADTVTYYRDDEDRTPFMSRDPGRQWFYILAGVSMLIIAVALVWGMIVLTSFIKYSDGSDQPAIGQTTSIRDVIAVDQPIPIGVESRENGVVVRINSITPKSRYTIVDLSVINNSTMPVSFMGLLDAQLVDDSGNPAPVDFQTAQGFLTINPGVHVRGELRFLKPVTRGTRVLTLIVNNVGTLQNRWYYEIPFRIQ